MEVKFKQKRQTGNDSNMVAACVLSALHPSWFLRRNNIENLWFTTMENTLQGTHEWIMLISSRGWCDYR